MRRVTVVIPTRNRHELLERALQSAFAQDLPIHEVIVVDEASEAPVDLGGEAIVVRHNQPKGPAAARNAGALRATGDVVAFLDDDDLWLPEKVAWVNEAFDRIPDADVVFHSVGFRSPENPKSKDFSIRVLEQPIRRMLLPRPPHPSGLAVTADVMTKIQFDETMPAAADLDFNLRLAEVSTVVEIEKVLAVHGDRPQGATDVSLDRRIAGRLAMRERHSEYFKDPEVKRHHEYRLAHLYRRSGQSSKAMAGFVRLALSNPFDARPWKGLAVTAFPTLSRVSNR